MSLSKVLDARGTRTSRRRTFCPESLEGRNLLSGMAASLPAAEVSHGDESDAHLVPQHGVINGVATIELGTQQPDGVHDIALPVTSTGTGNISHLGRVTLTETHTTTILAATRYKTTSVTGGMATITAANGDQLFLSFSGTGVNNGHGFNDTFQYQVTGGTGRFEDATGHGTILSSDGSVSAPFPDGKGGYAETAPFTFTLDGVISKHGSDRESES